MPANKNAVIRYLYLDRLFQCSWGYAIDEILEKLNDYLYDYDNSSVSKNTVLGDIEFMESTAGWRIRLKRWRDGHKVLMRYEDPDFSIMNMPLSHEQAKQLGDTIQMLSQIKGLPNFRWLEPMLATLKEKFGIGGTPKGVVALAQNEDLAGLEWYGDLFDAIVAGRVVEIRYHRFGKPTKTRKVHPYQLKQYNNRWFLVASEEANRPRHKYVVLPLDRMEGVTMTSERFSPKDDGDFDFREYFKHIVGVSLLPEGTVTPVVVKVRKPDAWYMETKPIHGSQNLVEESENYMVFRMEVIPNEELIQALMVYADECEVLEPSLLRDEINARARKILANNDKS